MNIIFYIAIISIIAYFVLKLINQKKENSIYLSQEGNIASKPLPIKNDKLIYVENVSLNLLKQAVEDFTNNYRDSKSAFPPPCTKIHIIDNTSFIITFPENIDFEIFCYFINYLKYPFDIDYEIEITAWTTTKSDYIWLNKNFENESSMIYIATDDNEYDNVIITLQNGTCYKLDFGGNLNELDDSNLSDYESPKYTDRDLSKYKTVEIK
jgi:hypothetical protein